MKERQPAIYILTNKYHGTLYTGVTSNLIQRIYQHKSGAVEGFTKKYDCSKLVFYEFHESMLSAIAREKKIKAGTRKRKIELIEKINPKWNDLYQGLL
ncbi:MAG: GIY-YIG nuclease family protein [Gammaproteobacteria bacterium]|nr:GIY-YIG nuclease family protein [Gammaproteobacteria bacterium]